MRIIRGSYKGRAIKAPRGTETRPTTDRVRESVFQILETRWLEDGFSGRFVFDLYAGSGALGIEALSRGAEHVVFFEANMRAIRTLRSNLRDLQVDEERFQVVTRALPSSLTQHGKHVDAKRYGAVSVIFSDPPYSDEQQDELGPLLDAHPGVASDAVWCHECSRHRALSVEPWTASDQREYGDTSIRLMFRD